jgi:hypothetical protein
LGRNWHRQGGIPLLVRYFEAGLIKLVYFRNHKSLR